ncbi:hypothetical protein ACFQ0X_30350 [Streptomyces rectiviolaceus]|uniref:Uncharacterized protein n=1 Tax=Streptomyces rectiviolaceus TaxID=332591 RepID=A0ABP6MDE0_9ACTN
MSSTWLIYSGALMVLLSAGLMMFTGRPVTPVRRDPTSIACGVIIFAAVCVLALLLGAPAAIAVSGACFWMAAAITGTYAVRGRIGSRG